MNLKRINKEYSKISSYNLSETNAVFSILNSSELVNFNISSIYIILITKNI